MATYSSITEFTEALERAKLAIPAMVTVAVKPTIKQLAAGIRLRVSSTGKDSDNGSFSPYSEKYKSRKKKAGSGAYGKTTAFKNFYLSGTMWNGFGELGTNLSGMVITSEIGFAGSNNYASNRELNEIHSDNEKQGIAYPTKQEELEFVARVEEIVYQSLIQLI